MIGLDFALCPDPERDEKLRPIVSGSVEFLLDRIGRGRVRAVVLMGSLSRGEGSILLGPKGTWRLLGDVEFIVVLNRPSKGSADRAEFLALAEAATREVGGSGRLATIEYGPVRSDFFKTRIKPSIVAYDLRHFGKVVWGEPRILDEMPDIGVEDIPPSACVELLMNRMAERLLLDGNGDGRGDAVQEVYHLAKTQLDLAGSLLAFSGRHEPRYLRRPHAFRQFMLARDGARPSFDDPDRLLAAVEWAAEFKQAPAIERIPGGGRPDLVTTELGRRSQIRWMAQAWAWEMRALSRRPAATLPELVHAYAGSDSLPRTLRGWAKFCLHPLRPAGVLSPRRIVKRLLRGTPQALTYAAAVLAYAGMADPDLEWTSAASDLLPVSVTAETGAAIRRSVGETWNWLIRNN